MKKFFLGAAILITCYFAAPNETKAVVFAGEFDFDAEYHQTFNALIEQELTPGIEGTLTHVDLFMKQVGFFVDPHITLFDGTTNQTVCNIPYQTIPTTTAAIVGCDLEDPILLTSDKTYFLRLDGNGNDNYYIYGNNVTQGRDMTNGGFTQTEIKNIYWSFEDGIEPDDIFVSFNPRFHFTGMQSKDFIFWSVLLDIEEQFLGQVYGVAVDWGASSTEENIGEIQSAFVNSNQFIMEVPKLATSSPGEYVAIARLYSRLEETNSWIHLADSAELEFEITEGEITLMPPDLAPEEDMLVVNCPPTNSTIFGVDFGVGFCQVVRFLFVPSRFTLDKWAGLSEDLQAIFPFSMFFEFREILAAAQVDQQDPLIFSYLAPSSSPIGSFSIDAQEVMTETVGEENQSYIYGFMTIVLYFAFGVYVVFRLKNFF